MVQQTAQRVGGLVLTVAAFCPHALWPGALGLSELSHDSHSGQGLPHTLLPTQQSYLPEEQGLGSQSSELTYPVCAQGN